jgi:antitoxin (DNA-binding transcriptional repressor) of toxin-antitoxin stability system
MRSVNIATLKAKLSEYLRMARDGETIHILDRHRAVATLSGVTRAESVRIANMLVQQGLAEWHGGKPAVRPLKPRKGPAALADAVLQDRE